jgi:hypothetical protein
MKSPKTTLSPHRPQTYTTLLATDCFADYSRSNPAAAYPTALFDTS